MKYYDEYQKLMCYKHGHHAFYIVIALSLANFILNIQWAETKTLEFGLFLLIAVCYSILMNVYTGAFFNKWQFPSLTSLFYFILGMTYIFNSFSSGTPMTSDGQITENFLKLTGGLLFLSIPVVYFTRKTIEYKENDSD
ncbi:hypothetical protein SAMN04488102_11423 [Alkalibacterium subtropicum]|uniref:Uncharacterized protein n=1 Tax=Alkalibacterium subtropicum TaxID=753702 RepID=A0A1I1KPK1_9LACT|nr:hypothetical protein [Alkalibacterium subtropicum]SFC62621.1 hypothetical protein SAMN04488102_11423 [Alkalibacterium subtropicum]